MNSKIGPFELGKVHCVDCLEAMKQLPDGCVDAVVTDPPYGIGEARGKNKSRGNLAIARDYGTQAWDDTPCSDKQIAEIQRVSRWQIVFGGNYFTLPPSSCWLVWDKMNTGDFADCELAWTNLSKAVRIIHHRWNGMLRDGNDVRVHPTQKPENVMMWCLSHVAEAAIILDPFAGSGTTGVACVKLNRQFLGFEIDPEYCRIANERIEAARKGLTVQELKAGQKTLF